MTEGSRKTAAAEDDLAYPTELAGREQTLLERRRARAGVPDDAVRLGMAFSGGGTRAAAFSDSRSARTQPAEPPPMMMKS